MKVGQFTTEDSMNLFYNCWPGEEYAPSIVYIHGLESHSGWFFNFAEYMNSKGMNVYSFDRRGSGLNRICCKEYSARHIISDLNIFLDLVKKDRPNSRIFLTGFCLGAKIAVTLFAFYKARVNGLILVSPAIRTKLKFSLADRLSILFRKNSMIESPIKDRMFTSNEKYLKYIQRDILRLRHIPSQHMLEIAKMDIFLNKAAAGIHVPVLVIFAGIDEVIDEKKVKKWFEKIPSRDKEIKTYQRFHHLITFEEHAPEMMDDVAGWIKARDHD